MKNLILIALLTTICANSLAEENQDKKNLDDQYFDTVDQIIKPIQDYKVKMIQKAVMEPKRKASITPSERKNSQHQSNACIFWQDQYKTISRTETNQKY